MEFVGNLYRPHTMQSLNALALNNRRHTPCIKHWTKLMTLMKNRVQFMRIIMNQGAPKTPLPIVPKGPQHMYVHFKQILLGDKPNNLQYSGMIS
jgi:hypothetical protein